MTQILKTPAEYAQNLRRHGAKDQWTNLVFEAAQAHPSVPAAFFAEVLAEMPVWGAGDRTFRVEWFDKWNNTSHDEEFLHEPEAMALVKERLDLNASQVNVTRWMHEHNLPRALPAIKASVLSLTTYVLDDEDQLVEKPVDIFGTSY